jgi:multiple sugar transport system substrate-binding protein
MQSKFRQNFGIFFAVAVPVLVATAFGCGRPASVEEQPVPMPFEGQIVKVVSPGEPVTTLLKRYAPSWAKKVGAQAEIVTVPNRGDLTTSPDASAWIVRAAEMPRWAAAGQLEPVPPEYRVPGNAYGWSGLLPLYRDKLLRWADEAYALPLLGDAPACFYRADLFADGKHQQAFRAKYGRDLAPPQTWDDVVDIAEYFHGNREPGKPAPSLPPLPESAEQLDYTFYAVAAPHTRGAIYQDQKNAVKDVEVFSFHYDFETGEPRIAQAGFVHALQLLQKLQRFRPPAASHAPLEAFADGQAVVCLAEASAVAQFRKNLPAASIGVCEVPGSARWFGYRDAREHAAAGANRIPYQGAGGWVAVVPRSAPHARAAFALFASLSDPSAGTQVLFEPQWGGGAYRDEHLRPNPNWYSFDLDETRTRQLREAIQQTVARPGLVNPAVRLRIPDQHLYQQALVEQVRGALTSGGDARQALEAVAKRWTELDAAKQERKRKNDYLLSLGLSPI